MHELSIAMSIVEIAEENIQKANLSKVTEIELDVGELSGVVYDALEFAMEEAVKDTVLKDAVRKINRISGKARCNDRACEFELDDIYTPCPKCASFDNEIIKGKELKVMSLIAE
jgi:hydrogenase nickel incorporation protein HypA/HybF